MNEQPKQEPDIQQSLIEDLAVNEDQSAEVNGGLGDGSVKSVSKSVTLTTFPG